MDTHVTELKTEPTGMKAVLLYANRTLEPLWLPRRPEGRFRFVLSATGAEFPSFYIEGANGRWFACCSAPCVFTNCSDQEQHRTVLGDSTFLTIQDGKMEHFLYMEACNTYSNLFQNFRICGTQPLTIGRTPDNDIAYCLACQPCCTVPRGKWNVAAGRPQQQEWNLCQWNTHADAAIAAW